VVGERHRGVCQVDERDLVAVVAQGGAGDGPHPSPNLVPTTDAYPTTMGDVAGMCELDGCDRPTEARGLCHAHYEFWRRRNSEKVLRLGTPLERLKARIEVDPKSGCWVWTGYVTHMGYGRIRVNGRSVGTHRLAYELLVAPIAEGLHLDHLCRNPPCCNPAHLEPVTSWENANRGIGSPPVLNSQKTHCIYGHEFTPANTSIKPNGARRCKTCDSRRQRDYYARKVKTGTR
jgi:hypothetical protein